MGKKQMVAALCTMGMLAMPVQAAENSPAPGRELYGILNSLCQLVRQQVLEEEPVCEAPLPESPAGLSQTEPAQETLAAAEEAPSPTPKISLTPQEVSMMEYVVEREVHGASYAHKIAVANVIVNRVLDSRFPGTVEEVLHAPKQFPISIGNYYNPKWHPSDETINAVYAAVYEPDTTGGALYFYAPRYTAGKTASWFENSLTFCFEMEGHRFFSAAAQ
ncbi:cell wall hydrolase [Intestinimonas butyriciproducens]|uniref:cell wall hydrolase n=1 Tax=Intestinimonas butyriciproducens TaxID=1297617 RepID=UPI00195AF80D|nr:cell wall hydrolase [Intestinimonas butyriciproducens]